MAASEMDNNNDTTTINSEQYFEGTEKLLEIWFAGANDESDLRKIPRCQLEALLKLVRCEIISFKSNDHIDAYVLSESSLFVSKRRVILKTCGTTTPLMCLGTLLDLAVHVAGFTCVQDLFYSRKNYGKPELQRRPHKTFEQEVAILNSYFQEGSAYCLGSSEDHDCWYLYTLQPAIDSPQSLYVKNDVMAVDSGLGRKMKPENDQTLEILMMGLDAQVMAIFTKAASCNAATATKNSGIDNLIPHMEIDDYLFEPCGYSMNGITKSGYYMTIHITPEPKCSYVSFETNIPATSYRALIHRVLRTFQPTRALITIFATPLSVASDAPMELEKTEAFGDSWLQKDIQHCRFKYYDLTYALYSKFPS